MPENSLIEEERECDSDNRKKTEIRKILRIKMVYKFLIAKL